jgi:hypothetical protein
MSLQPEIENDAVILALHLAKLNIGSALVFEDLTICGTNVDVERNNVAFIVALSGADIRNHARCRQNIQQTGHRETHLIMVI